MKKLWMRSAALALTLAVPACGDDTTPATDVSTDVGADTTPEDTATPDTTQEDTATPDTTPNDTATPDTTPGDTAVEDTAVEDTATPDTTPEDTGHDTTVEDTTTPTDTVENDTSTPTDTTGSDVVVVLPTATLAELLAGFVGSANNFATTPNARVEGLTVTVLKPVVGTENGGFFVQEGVGGVATFVEFVDGATAAVAPGDVISINVERIVNFEGLVRIRTFSGVEKTGTVSDLEDYFVIADDFATPAEFNANQNRAIDLIGLVTGASASAGGGTAGYVRFPFISDGLDPADDLVRLRVPRAVADAVGLETNCLFGLSGAMWGFRGSDAAAVLAAQPSAYTLGAFEVLCDSPVLTAATATSDTQVTLTFSRPLLPETVTPGAFTISPSLEVTAVTLAPNGRSVTLTTTAQTAAVEYTVTVGDIVDVLGEAFEPGDDIATFTGFGNVVVGNKLLFCFEDDTGTYQLTPTVANGFTEVVFDRVTGGAASNPTSVTGSTNWDASGNNRLPTECVAGSATSNVSKAPTGASWPTTSPLDPSTASYFRLRFKAPAGNVAIAFDATRSGTGPQQLAIWTSAASALVGDVLPVNAEGTAFGNHPMFSFAGPVGTGNVALSFAIPDSTGTAFEIRFYPHASGGSGGTFRMDNLTVIHTPNP